MKIFISYGRSDSRDISGRICDRLRSALGESSVFMDVDDLPLGRHFPDYLRQEVENCHAFLAVIGDSWLTATDEDGKRRLDDPDDFVRIEIESALKRPIPLIPVLVGEKPMPAIKDLRAELRELSFRNGFELRSKKFNADMGELLERLRKVVDTRPDSDRYPDYQTAYVNVPYETGAVAERSFRDISNAMKMQKGGEHEFTTGYVHFRGSMLFEDWLREAEKGSAAAMCLVAYCHALGVGSEHSRDKAIEWFEAAAERNFALAQYNLWLNYRSSDSAKAARSLRDAAKYGSRDAIRLMKQERLVQRRSTLAKYLSGIMRTCRAFPHRFNDGLKRLVAGDEYTILFRFVQVVLYFLIPVSAAIYAVSCFF